MTPTLDQSAPVDAPPDLLRRVRRLSWFALTASAVLVSTTTTICGTAILTQAHQELAFLVIVVSNWAIIFAVAGYLRAEEARVARREQAARLYAARLVALLAKDRVKNKIAVTAGYSEFLADDPRLPDDLRVSAKKALEGAFAAARAVDELSDTERVMAEPRCDYMPVPPVKIRQRRRRVHV
jgi:hypothetical protein